MLELSVNDGKEVDAYHFEVLSWNYLLRSEEKYEKLGQQSSKQRCEHETLTYSHK
jgi:hypothetical protein